MAKIKVDFSKAESFDTLPEGTYDAVIEKIEYREPTNPNAKAPYLNVEYTIAGGEFDGRKVWEVLSFSPKGLFRMKDFFAAFGIDQDEAELDVDEDSNLLLDPDLADTPVTLTLEVEPHYDKAKARKGETVNRVSSVEPVDGPESDDEEAPAEDGKKGTFKPTSKKRSFK